MIVLDVLDSTRHLTQGQRRGAIIVLGMMASADRGVLTEHVDTMLKVGLGSLSKVSCAFQLVGTLTQPWTA